jgi:topoisomerase IA-like protein
MSKNDYPAVRKSAAIVKCPYCAHTGSSRGLYQHIRLSHNDISAKPPTTTKISAHPYDIKGIAQAKSQINSIGSSIKGKHLKGMTTDEAIALLVIPLAIGIFKEIVKHYNNSETLPSNGYKPM